MFVQQGRLVTERSRRTRVCRPGVEGLERRELLASALTEFPLPANINPFDRPFTLVGGDLWFGEVVYNDASWTTGTHGIGQITPDGDFTSFTPPVNGPSSDLVAGSDGNLWFVGEPTNLPPSQSALVRLTPTGDATAFPLSFGFSPTAGPNGSVWVLSSPQVNSLDNDLVGLATDGTISQYSLPPVANSGSGSLSLSAEPDGSLWLVSQSSLMRIAVGDNAVSTISTPLPSGRVIGNVLFDAEGTPWFLAEDDTGANVSLDHVTTTGALIETPIPGLMAPLAVYSTLTIGADGNFWFVDGLPVTGFSIVRVTPDGSTAAFPLGSGTYSNSNLVLGPDGNLWFLASSPSSPAVLNAKVELITPEGTITTIPLPSDTYGTSGLTLGPDGNLWFASVKEQVGTASIDRLDLSAIEPPPTPPTATGAGSGPVIAPPVTVEGVTRSGMGLQPTELTVTFSAGLDPATASNVASYSIILVGPRGRARPNARPIPIKSVIYNPATHTVTLTPRRRLPLAGYYQITIHGGSPNPVRSAAEVPLAGAGLAHPGTDFVAIIHRFHLSARAH